MKTLNTEEIIKRGYCFDEEYKLMQSEFKHNLKKLILHVNTNTESLWSYPLENNSEFGKTFHFIFCNDPFFVSGEPRPIAGMVGIATSQGVNSPAICNIDDCIELFVKAGQEPIDYFWKIHEKYEYEKHLQHKLQQKLESLN